MKGCPASSALSGASVNVTLPSGAVLTGTTPSSGCLPFCLDPYTSGTYPVSITAAGYQTFNGTLALSCGGTATVTLQPNSATPAVTFNVLGCNGLYLVGATCTLSDGQSCTTNSLGQCSLAVGDAGTYTWTVSKSRFMTATGSITISTSCPTSGAAINVTLSPASGYHCCPMTFGLADPLPTTLYCTDSFYGLVTLTYNGGLGYWIGTLSATYAGYCGCIPSSMTLTYTFGAGNCTGSVAYSLRPGSSTCPGPGPAGPFPPNQAPQSTTGVPLMASTIVNTCAIAGVSLYPVMTPNPTLTFTE